ncbi:MAG: HD domain-containing protein [Bacteroidales bacterium]|jgi:poly(A) polymerase|nr:HD domain-containing protein [Bacteroidales bacterium]MDD2770609.1 HD domain-containing protein [Bacteroidales bacterium]MDD3104651.1 HD domain-containing protein [Bacteroidales bacterium]MDD4499013.1 HD domain-containing protein [Bacteroidales bacterium]MDD5283452.1 HD domain-containing protein [Bacteroidales bacterium]
MKAPLKSKIFRIVAEQAALKNVKAYVIGGYVRDFYLNRSCTDIDIVIEGNGMEIASAVASVLETRVTLFKKFGTAMLRYKGFEIEFVGARKESYRSDSRKPIVENGTIEDDQKRRDFTINAMAFSLAKEDYGTLTDPFNGMDDLKQKVIRTPLNPDTTFSDDPLRMIRAIRFAAQLDFSIDDASFASVERNASRINIVSQERITAELQKIMAAPKPSIGFMLMEKSGLLALLIPQISLLKGVETMEGKGHKENFSHTMEVLDNVASASDNIWLRWAALLHDVGKPSTKHFDKKSGWTFHGHDFIGSKMIPGIFRQLRLPLGEEMRYVQKLVQLHLRPIALVNEVSDSGIRRLLFEAGRDIDDLMLLCRADITSKNPRTVRRHLENFEEVSKKMALVEEKDAIRNFQPPITGEIIMKTFGIPPCREVGQIKDYIKEAILDGKIGNNPEEARKLMFEKAQELGLSEVNA